MTLLAGLVLLLLIGGIVAMTTSGRSTVTAPPTGDGGDAGEVALRGVAVNALALLGVMVAASGLTGLLRVVLEALATRPLVSDTDTGLALGLSLTIVGLPVWVLAWRASQQAVDRSTAAARALPRRLHLGLTRIVALALTAGFGYRVLLWLLQVEPFDAAALARLIVWGAVWAYHEHVATRRPLGATGTRLVDRLEVYGAATVGLWFTAGAVGFVLERSLDVLYRAATGARLLAGGGGAAPDLRAALAAVLVGGAVWTWHWTVRGREDAGSTPWLATLFLAGVLAGTATAVGGAATVGHHALTWLLGAAGGTATLHFDVLPAALAALVVGAAVWGYHRADLREHAPGRDRTGPERTYWYLLTGAGVLTAAVGLTIILGIGLDLLVPGQTLVGDPETVREAVAAGLTALIVGLPLWGAAWRHVQRVAATDPEERTSLARRILIVGVLGAAVVATVVALGTVLFGLFEALLAGEMSAGVIEEQRWGIATVVTAAALSVHYGLVLREDREARADQPTEQPGVLRELLLVAPPADPLAGALADALQVTVTLWPREDGPATPGRTEDAVSGEEPDDREDGRTAGADGAADVTTLAGRVRGLGTPRVLVVTETGGRPVVLPVGESTTVTPGG